MATATVVYQIVNNSPNHLYQVPPFAPAKFDEEVSARKSYLLPREGQKYQICNLRIAENVNVVAKCCFFPGFSENLVTDDAVKLFSIYTNPSIKIIIESKTIGMQTSTSVCNISTLFQAAQDSYILSASALVVPGPFPEGSHFIIGDPFMHEYGMKFATNGDVVLSPRMVRTYKILTMTCIKDKLQNFVIDGCGFNRIFDMHGPRS